MSWVVKNLNQLVVAFPFKAATSLGYFITGIILLLVTWFLLSLILSSNPQLIAFADMNPIITLQTLLRMITDGTKIFGDLSSSLGRIFSGLFAASAIGIVLGVVIGMYARLRQLTHVPFQLLRMISPLAWMPIAVISFDTWDGAIIFIITAASIWPILFSVSGAIRRLNPEWFELADNLGANYWQTLRDFILPAVAQDIFAGIRLALGVAWIVLVPAELLGVTSGLGYALNDARDSLEYDKLAAVVLTIGIVGLLLDSAASILVNRWAWQATTG